VTLTPLWVVVDLLACYRITRLITKDELTARLRWWFAGGRKTNAGGIVPGRRRFLFITCPHCIGVWVAAAVVVLTACVPAEWKWPALGFALAAGASLLSEWAS
jgi:hypothetical protein